MQKEMIWKMQKPKGAKKLYETRPSSKEVSVSNQLEPDHKGFTIQADSGAV